MAALILLFQLRAKEGELQRERALLEQREQHRQIEREEREEREQNQKKMYEKMLAAIKLEHEHKTVRLS